MQKFTIFGSKIKNYETNPFDKIVSNGLVMFYYQFRVLARKVSVCSNRMKSSVPTGTSYHKPTFPPHAIPQHPARSILTAAERLA